MIVKMMKYDILLLQRKKDEFIENLRELGLVDITTLRWEPSDGDRVLLQSIAAREKALASLEMLRLSPRYVPSGSLPKKDYDTFAELQADNLRLAGEEQRLQKLCEEWKQWGDFSSEDIVKLSSLGMNVRFYSASMGAYETISNSQEDYVVYPVSVSDSQQNFVVISSKEVPIDAQEHKIPQYGVREMTSQLETIRKKILQNDASLSAIADDTSKIVEELSALRRQLQNVKIVSSAEREVEDHILVLEGWAEKDNEKMVDSLLDKMEGVYYLKRNPKPEDNTPVKLKNNRFASLFELIGSMYALPKYGTLDLTPFFAPFYMLFFAICLNDAGYGAMIFLLGLFLHRKGASLRKVSWLSMLCGAMTILFGTYTGSLFGMNIPEQFLGYESIASSPFLDFQNQFFTISLALGVLQIIIGMIINVCMTTSIFGFKYALGSLGWLLVLLSGVLSAGLPALNPQLAIPGFTTSSPAFLVMLVLGAVLMLFLNSPEKNIFANFGAGLWNTYNNITGILSDVLSYIRLFAIGLSGGVLALVFNDLALGLTGLSEGISQMPLWMVVVKILMAAVIILIGHGINLFMSTISSFVHPMRLTFVEFYKNAGFEMASREFKPIKNE